MKIENSKLSDLPQIMAIYKEATAYMKSKNQVSWPKFPEAMIINELREKRQWKLLIKEEIACIWATTFSDPIIWGAKNDDPAVYIHRIATHPKFRGNGLAEKFVYWVKKYAKDQNKKFIRLDTVGENESLIKLYKKIGFNFLGMMALDGTVGLPEHYKNGEVCFFEIELKNDENK